MTHLKDSFSNIIYYPVEIILLILLRPLFADYLSIVLPAVLFFYAGVGIIFYLKLRNFSIDIWKIIAIKYLALAILAFVYFYSSSVVGSIIFGALFVLLFIIGYREKSLKAKVARARLFMGAVIILMLPLVFVLAQSIFIGLQNKSIENNEYARFNQHLTERQKTATEKADLIAQDPMIIDFLAKRDYPSLLTYSQNVMIAHDLSYFVITSGDGTVVVKAHAPGRVGSNLFELYSPAGTALASNDFSGISIADESSPYEAAGRPLKKNGVAIGTVFVGNFLNDSFLDNLPKQYSYGLAKEGKVIASSNNPIAKNVFLSKDLIIPISKTGQSFLHFQNKNYLLVGIPLTDQSHSYIGTLLILKDDASTLPSLLTLLVVSLLVMIVYIIDLWPIAKIENLKLKHLDFISKAEKFLLCLPILLIVSIISLKVGINLNRSANSPEINSKRTTTPKIEPSLSLKMTSPYVLTSKQTSIDLYAISNGVESESVVYKLSFPANLIRVVSIIPSDTYCKQIIGKEINNENGTADFACELPTLSSINEPRRIATINLAGLKAGIADFSIDSSSSYILTAHGNSSNLSNSAQKIIVSSSE